MAKTTGGSWIFPAVVVATTGAAVAAQTGTQPIGVWVFAVVLGGWVITLCLHEFAHAAVAYAGGDISVRARGYLTLNPLRYTDLAYSVIIPILLLAVGGIPLPGGAVLVEPGRLRRRWYASVVSAAGPMTNMVAGILIAIVASTFVAASGGPTALAAALSYLALLQFVAGILNLLPIPGFDGFGIIEPYLSYRFTERLKPFRPWIPLVVFFILFSVPGASSWLFTAGARLLDLAGGSTSLANAGARLFRFWA
jgi:Zn-dependent protease